MTGGLSAEAGIFFQVAVLSQQVAGENPLPCIHLQPLEFPFLTSLHIVLDSCPTDISQKEARAVVLSCDVALENDDHIVWPPVQGQLDRPFSSSGFLITKHLVEFAFAKFFQVQAY